MFIDYKIFNSLQAIADRLWEVEKYRFQEATGIIVDSEELLDYLVSLCEKKGLTDCTFYHLMIIKQSLFNPF